MCKQKCESGVARLTREINFGTHALNHSTIIYSALEKQKQLPREDFEGIGFTYGVSIIILYVCRGHMAGSSAIERCQRLGH